MACAGGCATSSPTLPNPYAPLAVDRPEAPLSAPQECEYDKGSHDFASALAIQVGWRLSSQSAHELSCLLRIIRTGDSYLMAIQYEGMRNVWNDGFEIISPSHIPKISTKEVRAFATKLLLTAMKAVEHCETVRFDDKTAPKQERAYNLVRKTLALLNYNAYGCLY